MLLIIDGYNVLKYSVAAAQATAREKELFIKMMARYAAIKKLSIELVFDGGPLGAADFWQYSDRVSIRHSGAKESADEAIKRRIAEFKGQEILLISTDRELGRSACSYGIETLDSADFYRLVQLALKNGCAETAVSQKMLVKTGESNDTALDMLIAEHAETVGKSVDEEGGALRVSKGQQKASKREKRLEKLLRKL